jgi:maltooligosyltrehalose trehalohydrolase
MKQHLTKELPFDLGANYKGQGTYSFRVWAPLCREVDLKLRTRQGDVLLPMLKDDEGYFWIETNRATAGMQYYYLLDKTRERPDPAARSLALSPHGPAEIVDPYSFTWTDHDWKGIQLSRAVFYEVHVGTFTPEGTFAAVSTKLPYLKSLGVNVLEIMPVARFPGERNWGYDGTGLFAVQPCYGGSEGLKALVDASHREGIAVCLDVVYNHLGPEGNYLREFGPYFTSRYHVPWGEAVNFDGWSSGPVRKFFVENARYWVREFHIDALRLDAVHAIYDFGARHILEEINAAVESEGERYGRKTFVVAESDLNDSRLIRPVDKGGYGLAAQWSDDFHHSVHTLLTKESTGYYRDFGSLQNLAKALTDGFVYDGIYSGVRNRCHGNVVKDLPTERLVVAIQNHDQVGNRALGDRFGSLLSFEARKLAATLLLLSPYTPLLFMGEEYGEQAPFQYFIDHEDAQLVQAVREGRQRDFLYFGWTSVSDPKAEQTFLSSRLDWTLPSQPSHKALLRLYQDLLRLRKKHLSAKRRIVRVIISDQFEPDSEAWLAAEYVVGRGQRFAAIYSFSSRPVTLTLPFLSADYRLLFTTDSVRYAGGQQEPLAAISGQIALAPMTAVFLSLQKGDK